MALEDMPDISSPQFAGWLLQQDQQTQQEIMRYIGMDQASGNAPSSQGAFAPSISPFAYDVPSMLGGIPQSTNAKGVPNPDNVESAQKYLNYGQDLTGSAGLGNNMLSWMTGPQATDPTAWQPVKVGKGSPLQFENLSMVDALANSGGDDVQTFFAQELLKGSPAAAVAKLKALVRSGKATQGLLDSLSVNPNFDPAGATTAPDIKTDTGFATMYDVKGMLGDANDMFKGIAKDRALQSSAYQDPKTKQFYSGYDENKTEQMQAADKLGLSYPTSNYNDPSLVDQYTERSLGVTPDEAAYRDQSRERPHHRAGTAARRRGCAGEAAGHRPRQPDQGVERQLPGTRAVDDGPACPGRGGDGAVRPGPRGRCACTRTCACAHVGWRSTAATDATAEHGAAVGRGHRAGDGRWSVAGRPASLGQRSAVHPVRCDDAVPGTGPGSPRRRHSDSRCWQQVDVRRAASGVDGPGHRHRRRGCPDDQRHRDEDAVDVGSAAAAGVRRRRGQPRPCHRCEPWHELPDPAQLRWVVR